jgi:hypothetical protein
VTIKKCHSSRRTRSVDQLPGKQLSLLRGHPFQRARCHTGPTTARKHNTKPYTQMKEVGLKERLHQSIPGMTEQLRLPLKMYSGPGSSLNSRTSSSWRTRASPPGIVRHMIRAVYARFAKAHTQLSKGVRGLMQEKKQKTYDIDYTHPLPVRRTSFITRLRGGLTPRSRPLQPSKHMVNQPQAHMMLPIETRGQLWAPFIR